MEPTPKRLCFGEPGSAQGTSTAVDAPVVAPPPVIVEGLMSPADQSGVNATWLCEHGSPRTASHLAFMIEALTNYQRGFSRIAPHLLSRLLIASGNDKSSAPDAHVWVSSECGTSRSSR